MWIAQALQSGQIPADFITLGTNGTDMASVQAKDDKMDTDAPNESKEDPKQEQHEAKEDQKQEQHEAKEDQKQEQDDGPVPIDQVIL